MTERVKLALVGCGGMGRRHLRGLAILTGSSMANVDLVAVCDLNDDNAQYLASEAEELLGHRPAVYNDLETMVREVDDLQAASVTTDAGSHHKVAPALLDMGLNVLCEKPLAVTMRGCNRVVDATRRAQRILSVAENYRRDPINRLARALLDDGAIGTPRLMIETSIGGRDRIAITPWRHMKHTGSITLDAGVHNADILRYYMGEPRTVYGESRLHEKIRRNTGSAGPGGFYGRWSKDFPETIEPTGEDALYAFISFESGAVGQWTYDQAGHGQPGRARVVYGSRGSLESPGDRNGRPIRLHFDDGTVVDDGRILEYAPGYRLSPLAAELFGGERVWTYGFDFNETDSRILALEYHELGECVLTGAPPEVTGEEARADVALTYAPFEAGRLGRPVTLEDLISGRADVYQREIDEMLGLLTPSGV
ncbi:MAG: Gfo/Idh/MocA family oxidoreductase [Chloroflexota bacterium]|nr:Gfo/Idh/MocA family oxidoreductase [Chloroflexota bacterium]